jgi:hypothetical protein
MIALQIKSKSILRLTGDYMPDRFYVELRATNNEWQIYVPEMSFGGTFSSLLLIELVEEADRVLKCLEARQNDSP